MFALRYTGVQPSPHPATINVVAVLAIAVGVVALLGYTVVLRAYKRRIDRALQSELARLEQASLTDTLTELGNHRAYREGLQQEIARARRHGEPLVVARLDLDLFRLVNDQQGHGRGDMLLVALAQVLRGGRAYDRAYRLGSDEFALILPHATGPEAVTALERVQAQAHAVLRGATVSIGVAQFDPGASDIDLVDDQADAALGEAKRRGGNAVVTFDEISDSVAILSPVKMTAVQRLLAERRMRVAFQPIWDLERGVVLAYEALARLPQLEGLEGPQEAFDVAERLGCAHDLDTLCREATLARASEIPPDTLLFMNVSPYTLEQGVLAGNALVDAVTSAGLSPEQVVLEVTERSVARIPAVVREARRLRALGFQLALDDVGAGNAGLEMLRQLPVDVVKIDRAVIMAAPTDPMANAVLAAILAFAQAAGSRVIAEGIETDAMLAVVRHVGRVESRVQVAAQGYLLGRPSEALPPVGVVTHALTA